MDYPPTSVFDQIAEAYDGWYDTTGARKICKLLGNESIISLSSTGLTSKRQDEKARQGELSLVTKLGQADHHVRVPFVRLVFVGAEQPVPQG
jgi:hypothetical protein